MSGWVEGGMLPAVLGALALAAAWNRWLTRPATGVAGLVGLAVWSGAGAVGVYVLLLFFVSASALTRLRVARSRSAGSDPAGTGSREWTREPPLGSGRSDTPEAGREVEPEARGPRRTRQVLANGGVAALAALAGRFAGLPGAELAVLGGLAAATADTWATEAGRIVAGGTRDAWSWERVPPGRTGGVSAAGTTAAAAGGLLLGAAAGLLGAPGGAFRWAGAGLAAGLAGAVADSLLGATLEHRAGRVGNDGVNLAGTTVGALVGWTAGRLLGL